MRVSTLSGLIALMVAQAAQAEKPFPKFRMTEIDPHVGNVCYALTLADVNGDGKPDIVAVTENAVVWFENPSWHKRTIIENQTERDNVCIAPNDIDGDGKVDFALGASWQPSNTDSGGTIQWLRRGANLDEKWTVHPIGSEPTVHRMRWGDLLGSGRPQLVVSPLQGRGTKGPDWGAGRGVRLQAFSIPRNPMSDPWPVETIDDTLHCMHNHWICDFFGTGRPGVLASSWEGVHWFDRHNDHWSKLHLGSGDQTAAPFKGSSEIKPGAVRGKTAFFATIEPWHGHAVVLYLPPDKQAQGSTSPLWSRRVIDDTLKWGHAVWTADLDSDGVDELLIGQRDKGPGPIAGPGVFIYRARNPELTQWEKIVVDDGGVATEDLVAGDLNGDGRVDIVAGGRATHNVRIYENLRPAADSTVEDANPTATRVVDHWRSVERNAASHFSLLNE